MTLYALGLFEDLAMWGELGYWVLMAVVALWLYKWAEDHLAFSPVLAIAVALILIYYLVFLHPWAGVMALVGYMILFSGIMYMLPYVFMFLPFHKK